MKDLTPQQLVEELDRYIIGQQEAKKCVAIAVRNRWRRQQLPSEMRDDVVPKNIIMIGPTGVGKTEIARRLAHLVHAPFLKVEASRYTEIGYHGRDVESMVRDLVELAVGSVRQEHAKAVQDKARKAAEDRLIEMLLPSAKSNWQDNEDTEEHGSSADSADIAERRKRARDKMREKLLAGQLESRTVELNVEDRAVPMVEILSNAGVEQMGVEFQNMFEKLVPTRQRARKVTVSEARQILIQQEADKLIDKEKVVQEAVKWAENMGIIFIDEIDKIIGSNHKSGPDVSREGVQRDLLPVVEGCSVLTRYGMAKSDHILFIAAGAFSNSKPTDLIPELQGRFPIRVELKSLTKEDFARILEEPHNALSKQYRALLATEGVDLEFTREAILEIADVCATVNQKMQNIGARRLHTVMEKLLEDISFRAPQLTSKKIVVDAALVKERLQAIVEDEDLSRYIL